MTFYFGGLKVSISYSCWTDGGGGSRREQRPAHLPCSDGPWKPRTCLHLQCPLYKGPRVTCFSPLLHHTTTGTHPGSYQWVPSGPIYIMQVPTTGKRPEARGGRREKRALVHQWAPRNAAAFIHYKTKNKFRTRDYLPTNVVCIETILFKKKIFPQV